MSETEIKVPNIGDFKNVEVIEVLVSEGQALKKNDPLITKNNASGIRIMELIILLINSCFIKYCQNFSLFFYIFLIFHCNHFH